MQNKSSLTALISLFGRVYHAEHDNPVIFDDSLGRKLMTAEEYEQIKRYMLGGIDFFAPNKKQEFATEDDMLRWIVQTQIAPTPLARARYCEDELKTAVLTGTRQYIILGAGMDTFAFRSPELMERLQVFEVDHPATQEDKRKRVSDAGWEIPHTLHFVPMDFTKDGLAEKLLAHGYRPELKTFFSWLGVSFYLTKGQIEAMLKSIAAFAAEGSTLLFDYATNELFNSTVKRVRNMLAMAAAGGEKMESSFSYQELEQTLEKHRFLIYEHLDSDEIQQRFFAGRTDYLKAFEHISYTLAVLK